MWHPMTRCSDIFSTMRLCRRPSAQSCASRRVVLKSRNRRSRRHPGASLARANFMQPGPAAQRHCLSARSGTVLVGECPRRRGINFLLELIHMKMLSRNSSRPIARCSIFSGFPGIPPSWSSINTRRKNSSPAPAEPK
jgi:hypothetical protein